MTAPDANGWMPIETAPKEDGVEVLTWGCLHIDCTGETPAILISSWDDQDLHWYSPDWGAHGPTHWQPLPKPPVAS